MGLPRQKMPTYDDLLAAARQGCSNPELMDGEIVYKPMPRARHSNTQGAIRGALNDIVQKGDGDGERWWILTEADIEFRPGRILCPDVSGWRRSRLPTLPDGVITVIPDWVCEVLSPGHILRDRVEKSEMYWQEGVPAMWLAHPEEHLVEVYLRRSEPYWSLQGVYSPKYKGPIAPFTGLELDVSTLFDILDGEPPPVVSDSARL